MVLQCPIKKKLGRKGDKGSPDLGSLPVVDKTAGG
jgi:hypothetical protein